MSKLTLSLDKAVISRAKQYARQQGVSISKIVETYLATVSGPTPMAAESSSPMLRSVRGILRKANVEGYRRHLAAKYR